MGNDKGERKFVRVSWLKDFRHLVYASGDRLFELQERLRSFSVAKGTGLASDGYLGSAFTI